MQRYDTQLAFARLSLGDNYDNASTSSRTSTSTRPTSAAASHPPLLQSSRNLSTPLRTLVEKEKDKLEMYPWMSKFQKGKGHYTCTMQHLDEELEAFLGYIRHTPAELSLRKQVIEVLQRAVQTRFPDARLEVFGSVATGLFLPDGDIDLVMHCQSLISVQSAIDTLRHLLISLDLTTPADVRAVHGAKVPILKFRTTPGLGDFDIDISFNLDNGPAGAREQLRLLKEIGPQAAHRVSCLVVILKAFLTVKGLMEVRDGGIGGLTLFCMIVAFFQHPEWLTPQEHQGSVGTDLMDFLLFYGYYFPYQKYTIITANGGQVVEKHRMRWKRLPEVNGLDRLSIQHPVELDRDLASGSYNIQAVKEAFRSAIRTLDLYSNSQDDSSSYIAKVAFRNDSILGTIGIKIRPELKNRRAANERLIASRDVETLVQYWSPYPIPPKPISNRGHNSNSRNAARERGSQIALERMQTVEANRVEMMEVLKYGRTVNSKNLQREIESRDSPRMFESNTVTLSTPFLVPSNPRPTVIFTPAPARESPLAETASERNTRRQIQKGIDMCRRLEMRQRNPDGMRQLNSISDSTEVFTSLPGGAYKATSIPSAANNPALYPIPQPAPRQKSTEEVIEQTRRQLLNATQERELLESGKPPEPAPRSKALKAQIRRVKIEQDRIHADAQRNAIAAEAVRMESTSSSSDGYRSTPVPDPPFLFTGYARMDPSHSSSNSDPSISISMYTSPPEPIITKPGRYSAVPPPTSLNPPARKFSQTIAKKKPNFHDSSMLSASFRHIESSRNQSGGYTVEY